VDPGDGRDREIEKRAANRRTRAGHRGAREASQRGAAVQTDLGVAAAAIAEDAAVQFVVDLGDRVLARAALQRLIGGGLRLFELKRVVRGSSPGCPGCRRRFERLWSEVQGQDRCVRAQKVSDTCLTPLETVADEACE